MCVRLAFFATVGDTAGTISGSTCGWIAPMTPSLHDSRSPLVEHDADGAAAVGHDFAHLAVVADGAAMVLNAGDQRIGQAARAADRHAEAELLEEAEEHVGADPGRFLVGADEVLARHAAEVRLDLVVLEQLFHQVEGAHAHRAHDLAAFGALVHHRGLRAHRHRRRVQPGLDHRQPLRRLLRHGEERLGVTVRELADRLGRPGGVAVERQRRAVFPHAHHRHFGEHVLEAVLALEAELVVQQQRVALNEDVAHRVLVVAEPRPGQLARHDAAAEPFVALEHEHLAPGDREVGCRYEAVVARTDDHDVGVSHSFSFRS